MDVLLPLAAKSLLIAGVTLLLLRAMRRRSAADRSWVAHLGLGAIAVLPLAWLLLPQFEVATPLVASDEPVVASAPAAAPIVTEAAPAAANFPAAAAVPASASIDWAFWAYAVPAGLLLLLTLIALLRLVLLKAKANVLVEPTWLTALAHAQRRMGFKHGTALLTSDDLRSPISWGLMRPVILLNSEATQAHAEAEAIIAHELAHVARLDWVKLLLSRITVAMFWFNPLVWLLAREAHQLREEAADDAVLGSDIEDTEYARLLVGIARHECRGLLIGAHGVAPGRTSLARRVQRVLDAASQRAPGGWRWTAAAGFFAAGMAVPLATLHFVPMTPAAAHVDSVGGKKALADRSDPPATAAADAARAVIPEIISSATAGAIAGAVAAAEKDETLSIRAPSGATITTVNGETVLRAPNGGTISISRPDSKGRRRTVLRGPNGSVVTYADASAVPGLGVALAVPPLPPRPPRAPDDVIERAVEIKAVGASPEYVASIRSAAPHLAGELDHDDVIAFAALGVSPEYLRGLESAGYSRLSKDEIVEARALRITGDYARAMNAMGYGRLTLEQLTELRAVGVGPGDAERFRRAAGRRPTLDELVEMKALGVTPEDLGGADSP